MTEHRDSPEVEPEEADGGGIPPTRRFARLVRSPAVRRIALPKILAAVGIVLGLVIFAGVIGSRMIFRKVATGEEYQLPFSEIELIPAPEPWVKGGKARILEQVRAEANRPEKLSLLDLDLEQLGKDFRRCVLVKDVVGVERSYRSLKIHLTYRKPVAVISLVTHKRFAAPIDDESVYLFGPNIDWIADDDPFLAQGLSRPLVEIWGAESSRPPKPGLPWKRFGPDNAPHDPDPMVLRAARLAAFLQKQERTTPKGRPVPNFVSIRIPEPDHSFFIEDKEKNLVSWGKAPGDEEVGEPSSEARWKMFLEWIDLNGPLKARHPRYLYFTKTKAVIHEPSSGK